MDVFQTAAQIFGLAEVVSGWHATLRKLDASRRSKVAAYCDTVADTLARAGEALSVLATSGAPDGKKAHAARALTREIARLKGNLADLAELLEGELDGRKIAGVKRRLAGIVERRGVDTLLARAREPGEVSGLDRRLEMLSEAEGEFRALGDRLKV
ncbi:MAG: hypothetical protein AAFZ01_12605 [Pseudomonadota bacterium]